MTSRITSLTRFWLAWIFVSLLVYPLTAIFVLAFGMILYPLIGAVMGGMGMVDPASADVYSIFMLTGFGGIVALAVGILQAKTIKRYFYFAPEYWITATVIGGLIAAPITGFVLYGIHEYMAVNYWAIVENGQFWMLSKLTRILPMMMYVTVMSAIQMLVLRHYVRNAWLWIIANAIAGLMFSMVATVTFNPGFGDWLLAAVAQGAVTGFAMLFLLQNLAKEDDDDDGDREYAYQHVPIDIDD